MSKQTILVCNGILACIAIIMATILTQSTDTPKEKTPYAASITLPAAAVLMLGAYEWSRRG